MTNLDSYLTQAHAARRRTMLFSVAAGAAAGMISEWIGASQKISVAACILVVSAVEIMRAVYYVQPTEKWHRQVANPSPIRRSILALPVSALMFLVFAVFRSSRIEAAVVEEKLKSNAKDPGDLQNIKDTTRILTEAQAAKIRIDPNVLENAGQKFIRSTASQPSAWDAAIAIAQYRSFLNMDSQPLLKDLVADIPYWEINTQIGNYHTNPSQMPTVTAYGRVPPAETAILNARGKVPNEGQSFGVGFFVAEGDQALLDNAQMKNVVFRNVNILYSGGWTVMENVYFVNCVFGFPSPPNANILRLMDQILKSPSVNFTAQ